MAKRRKYGDAWKDVQIDAEQNDAVFDRFFKRTQPETIAPPPAPTEDIAPPSTSDKNRGTTSRRRSTAVPTSGNSSADSLKASVRAITLPLPNISDVTDILGLIDGIKRQYRLSKGEAAVLKYLLEKARESGSTECYAKIPHISEACEMTHRGCQFALRSLEGRGFVVRLKDYNPTDRLGIKFHINLPTL